MDTLSLQKFFGMLRGNSGYQPQVCDLLNTYIVNADRYDKSIHGDTNVFVTPAVFEKGKRYNNDFKESNVLFCEVDDIPNTMEHLLVFKPTVKMRTSNKVDASGKQLNSYHLYWELDEPIKVRTEFESALSIIKDLLGVVIDNGAIKSSQLLRIPFSIRHKQNDRQGDDSFSVVTPMYYNEGLTYSLSDFEVWRVLPKKIKNLITNKPKPNKRSEVDYAVITALVERGASVELIEKIFAYAPVGDKFREKGQDYLDLTISKVMASTSEKGSIEHDVIARKGSLWLETEDIYEQLTDFVPKGVATLIPYNDKEAATLYCITINGEDIYLTQEQMSDKRKFIKAIMFTSKNILCSPHRLLQIQKYILDELETVDNKSYYTTKTGIVKFKNVYERIPSGESELQFNPAEKSGMSNIRYNLHKGTKDTSQAIDLFLKLNNRKTTQSMLGWFTASLFKSFLREEGIDLRFPMLVVGGSANAGKTTIMARLFSLFGIEDLSSSSLAGTKTDFVLTKALSLSETMPIFIKEFRANAASNAKISELLRGAYDESSTARRGTSSQNVNEYVLNRPVAIDGQDTFEEIALTGRSVTVFVKAEERTPHALDNFDTFRAENKSFMYHFIAHVLDDINENRPQTIQFIEDCAREVYVTLQEHNLDARSVANLGVMWFGIKYLYDFADYKLPNIEDLLVCYSTIYNSKSRYMRNDATALIEYIISTHRVSKLATFKFDGEEIDAPDNFIEFNLSHKVRSYNKSISTSGMARTNVLSINAYRQQLDTHGLFIEPKKDGSYIIDKKMALRYGLLL